MFQFTSVKPLDGSRVSNHDIKDQGDYWSVLWEQSPCHLPLQLTPTQPKMMSHFLSVFQEGPSYGVYKRKDKCF